MHDGRLMRYSKKPGSRTLAMLLDPAVPRRPDGALAICQDCQRWSWFAGGYVEWLANRLLALADAHERLQTFCKHAVARLQPGEKIQTSELSTIRRHHLRNMVFEIADSLGWGVRVQRWTDGKVIIWRLA